MHYASAVISNCCSDCGRCHTPLIYRHDDSTQHWAVRNIVTSCETTATPTAHYSSYDVTADNTAIGNGVTNCALEIDLEVDNKCDQGKRREKNQLRFEYTKDKCVGYKYWIEKNHGDGIFCNDSQKELGT